MAEKVEFPLVPSMYVGIYRKDKNVVFAGVMTFSRMTKC